MRFKSEGKMQPELVTGGDKSRPALNVVHLNAEKSEVWVTDSYMAARFPVEVEDGDTSGPIPVEALKASRKPPLKGQSTSIRANSHVEVRMSHGEDASEPYVTLPRRSDGDYTFPNLAEIFPESPSEFEIGLDADKLYRLARAMGGDKVRVRFTAAPAGGPSPIRPMEVKPLSGAADAPLGLLMPIRVV